MDQDYKNDKVALLSAIEQADSDLHAHVSTYAVLETDDPLSPFEICWVHRQGAESNEAKLLNERLFDHAFLDFGYKEVRDEKNIEGTLYEPIEELFVKTDCIGVAPISFFDEDLASVRMAHAADEDEADEAADVARFTHFLHAVQGRVLAGEPARVMTTEDVSRVCGLLFGYALHEDEAPRIVAFQRTQRMWIQQKSSLLLFEGANGEPEVFSNQSIRVGTTFDFVIFDEKVFFRNLRALEILFKFNKLVSKRAKDYADTFDSFVADFEKLDERIEASRGVANKLLKMQREGCAIAELAPEEIERRANRIAYYSSKLSFNEEGKLMLTTNREVNDFLRMLNDDYVVSPLTNDEYEARSKKQLSKEKQASSESISPDMPHDTSFGTPQGSSRQSLYDDPFA